MKWILVAGELFAMSYGMMWVLYFIYGLFEKLVHKVDRKELSQKQLEKILWIASIIISIVIVLGIIISQY